MGFLCANNTTLCRGRIFGLRLRVQDFRSGPQIAVDLVICWSAATKDKTALSHGGFFFKLKVALNSIS